MPNLVNFLFNSSTETGILFCLELSNLSKRDSINEYHENRMIIQFYGTYFFLLFHKKKQYNGILMGFPLLDFIEIKSNSLPFSNNFISGVLMVFKEQKNFNTTKEFIMKFKNYKKKYQKFIEIDKLLYYLVDRKKKKILQISILLYHYYIFPTFFFYFE